MSEKSLKVSLRHQYILDELNRTGQVFVKNLADGLGVTSITVRKDLDMLAEEKKLMRVAGGAVPYAEKKAAAVETDFMAEKNAIAAEVLRYVKDGDTLFINSGTTSLCVAQALLKLERLNIVTNFFAVAQLLARKPSFRVILLGGELNPDYGFVSGGDAQDQLQRYQANWAILSVDGVDAEQGITTYHADEAILDRVMLARSGRSIIAADRRKIGKTGFSRICPVNGGTLVITDAGCDPEAVSLLQQAGLEVCLASMQGE